MEISRSAFVFFQFILVACLVVLMAGGVWFWLNNGRQINTDEAVIQIQLQRLQTSGHLYFSRLRFYTGVCSDIGVASSYRCNESEVAYAIEANLTNGVYYCVDSTDFSAKTNRSIGLSTKCSQ